MRMSLNLINVYAKLVNVFTKRLHAIRRPQQNAEERVLSRNIEPAALCDRESALNEKINTTIRKKYKANATCRASDRIKSKQD